MGKIVKIVDETGIVEIGIDDMGINHDHSSEKLVIQKPTLNPCPAE